MFCQACGAKNAGDARFCNMCGARIAAAGTPGGAVHQPTQLGVGISRGAPSAPARPGDLTGPIAPMSSNTTSISLEAIGVRTSKKTWTILGLSALALLAVGALGSYFYMRIDAKSAGAAAPEDPFTLGAPTVAEPIAQLPSTTTATPTPSPSGDAVAPSTTGPTTRHEGERVRGDREPRAAHAETTSSMGTHVAATGSRDAGAAPDTTAMTEAAPDTTAMNEPPDSASATADATAQDATGSDRDLEMELYQGRVRYLVRRYYVASAQRCFEHATTNNPSVHGQVVIAMQIGANGYVSGADVARNSTGDDTLGACLAGQARTWRLSPPPGGEPIQMNMPFSR